MTKSEALIILEELGNSSNMVKHALAAGFVMTALFNYFKEKNQKPELTANDWEIIGLLHDADYEKTEKSLDLHTVETEEKLKGNQVDQKIIDAVKGHADKAVRTTLMAKSIYAADELTGFIVACALVQPDKKLQQVRPESVLKKLKDSSFARSVDRDLIKTCKTELNIPLEEFVTIVLKAMQKNAKELRL